MASPGAAFAGVGRFRPASITMSAATIDAVAAAISDPRGESWANYDDVFDGNANLDDFAAAVRGTLNSPDATLELIATTARELSTGHTLAALPGGGQAYYNHQYDLIVIVPQSDYNNPHGGPNNSPAIANMIEQRWVYAYPGTLAEFGRLAATDGMSFFDGCNLMDTFGLGIMGGSASKRSADSGGGGRCGGPLVIKAHASQFQGRVLSASSTSGAAVVTNDDASENPWSQGQQWTPIDNGDGTFTFKNTTFGTCLTSGDPLSVSTCGSGSQNWKFVANSNGGYNVETADGNDSIDISGGQASNGATVISYATDTGKDNQSWDVVSTAVGPTDLALGQPAQQSSGTSAGSAVDGDDSTVAATGLDAAPWWSVDVGASENVNFLEATVPPGGATGPATVYVANSPLDSNALSFASVPGVSTFYTTLTSGLNEIPLGEHGTAGRYVAIQLGSSGMLKFGTVSVYGTKTYYRLAAQDQALAGKGITVNSGSETSSYLSTLQAGNRAQEFSVEYSSSDGSTIMFRNRLTGTCLLISPFSLRGVSDRTYGVGHTNCEYTNSDFTLSGNPDTGLYLHNTFSFGGTDYTGCADVKGGATSDGTAIGNYGCEDSWNQRWNLVPADTGATPLSLNPTTSPLTFTTGGLPKTSPIGGPFQAQEGDGL